MASRKRKPAIERGNGHSYGEFAGYDGISYNESIELSKELNRRGHTLTTKPNKKSVSDHEMMWDSLIDVNEKASRSYAKYNKKNAGNKKNDSVRGENMRKRKRYDDKMGFKPVFVGKPPKKNVKKGAK